MKVRVIGAGALGLLVSASLASAGADVELVTRTREQAEQLEMDGLLLTRAAPEGGRESVKVHPPVASWDEWIAQPCTQSATEIIALTVKQSAVTDELAKVLAERLGPSAHLVCFQNGIGHTDILSARISPSQIMLAVTTEGALKHSPTEVEHTGRGITWLGGMIPAGNRHDDEKMLKKLQNVLQNAGFGVSLSNQMTSKVWNKLLINAVINPLTAILQIANGKLLELPASRELMRLLYDEGVTLADKLNIELAEDLWEQLETVCRRTAANQSSMLQDVRAERLTELDAITGGLLAKAHQTGIQLPTHETVYRLVRSIEQQWTKK
ncbi:ketopantoate reductase family protein [Paenibacillus sp. NPDC056579]|uniref:ketopantoate reductase family protein n=1 Tax=Paenibacillus sp. NPDC056579 TaxID=3345871 RepID=UPI0036AC5C33